MYFASAKLDEFESVTPSRHNSSSLSIHPYFGKVDPSLARKAIELLSMPGETVLDPFCGSGTVVHDALTLGRNAIGWDSSPLAVLISTGKILGITTDEARELISFFATACPEISPGLFDELTEVKSENVPDMPRVRSISDWFAPNALLELAHLRARLNEHKSILSPVAYLYATLAFSKIITSASLQKGESSYCRTSKSDAPGRVFALFRNAIKSISKAANAFSAQNKKILGDLVGERLEILEHGYRIRHQDVTAELLVMDSRLPNANCASSAATLVTTSPPYLMSWDYGLYHKFRFYWLGFNLDSYEDTEIGRHLRRKDDDIPRYVDDMSKIFASLRLATKDNAHIVMVNALSVVYGKEIDTNALLIQCAGGAMWRCLWDMATLDIPGPHHGMYGSLLSRGASAPGKAGKKEHVLIFRKDSSVST